MGRLPVAVALEALDEDSLVRILKEPKNALTKQYAKLFELEEVKLTFEDSGAARDRAARRSSAAPARAACARSSRSCSPT